MNTLDRTLLGIIAISLCIIAYRVEVASRAVAFDLVSRRAESIATGAQMEYFKKHGMADDQTRDTEKAWGEGYVAFLAQRSAELRETEPWAASILKMRSEKYLREMNGG